MKFSSSNISHIYLGTKKKEFQNAPLQVSTQFIKTKIWTNSSHDTIRRAFAVHNCGYLLFIFTQLSNWLNFGVLIFWTLPDTVPFKFDFYDLKFLVYLFDYCVVVWEQQINIFKSGIKALSIKRTLRVLYLWFLF